MVLNDVIASKIKGVLKKNPQGLNITEMFGELDINRNTLSRYLETLLVSGQVEMRRLGMGKIYTLSERIPSQGLFLYRQNWLFDWIKA